MFSVYVERTGFYRETYRVFIQRTINSPVVLPHFLTRSYETAHFPSSRERVFHRLEPISVTPRFIIGRTKRL